MTRKRKSDTAARNWYRSDRFIQDGGRWFFYTREGTIEGPFESRLEATCRLEVYIAVTNSGIVSSDSGLALSA